jgi:hypothetical protein
MSTIVWFKDEEGTGSVADLNGIGAEYHYVERFVWSWTVKPGGTRSETPEVYSSGTAKTPLIARREAEEALLKADESYGHPFREEQEEVLETVNEVENA